MSTYWLTPHPTLFDSLDRGPAELSAGLPLAQRSYLGALLPESMLFVLESYGAGVFAEALAGDHDTPELVWTHKMRGQRLVPMLMQHLGGWQGCCCGTRSLWYLFRNKGLL